MKGASPIQWVLVMGLVCELGCQPYPLADGLPTQMDCSTCHGNKDNPAPPRGLYGATLTTAIGVGAHQVHLQAERISGPVPCTECHVVPQVMDGDVHPDPFAGRAQVTFGALAKAGGATPTWNPSAETCTNTYCHGATLRGALQREAPRWTQGNGSQITCTSCHGSPPGETHPANKNCETCHGDVVGLDGSIKTSALHINGTIEVSGHSLAPGNSLTCDSCHPKSGQNVQHTSHLAYSCATCHGRVVKGDATILGPTLHMDGRIDIQMTVGTWDPATKTCAGTGGGCHGRRSIAW